MGADGRQESERGLDAAAAAKEPQHRRETHHQVKHGLQNHQQASRLDGEQLFTIKLVIILINLINSRLKIIINIVVSKRTVSIVRNNLFQILIEKMYKVM